MKQDGGPAYPSTNQIDIGPITTGGHAGMSLRDYFAAHVQPQVEIDEISRCDDQDLLENYGTPEEIEEGFRLVLPEQPMYLSNIILRSKLEARARAAIRYNEADAMLAQRSKR